MNFFEHQERARNRTRWLIIAFILAAAATAIAIGSIGELFTRAQMHRVHLDWNILGMISLGVAATILIGTLYKIYLISDGGETIALAMGGRLVTHASVTTLEEKMLLNVVDEMAIASGVNVPKVFILDDESGMNAFAAGFRSHDAVIAVTSGLLKSLSRDELQGVIGHEFSHILNGDMLLNMRLVGMLYGLMLLTLIGRILMRARGRKSGGAVMAGLVLFLLGWIGYFWGRLIQAAVSRQREFLADSSSVQFTRNPEGIYNALKKIGLSAMGSLVKHSNADENRHFFFSDAFPSSWMSWYATHPPLSERLSAIAPNRKENLPDYTAAPVDAPSDYVVQRFAPPRAAESSNTSNQLRAYVQDPLQVQSILTAMILIKAGLPIKGSKETEVAAKYLRETKEPLYSILSLSLSTLDNYSDRQLEALELHLKGPIAADNKLSIFDFCVLKLISMKRAQKRGLKRIIQFQSFRGLRKPMQVMLSTFSHYSKNDSVHAFTNSGRALEFEAHELLPTRLCALAEFSKALDVLLAASAPLRAKCLEIFARAVVYDGQVLAEEEDLIRCVSMILECPAPELLTKYPLGRPAQTA